MIELRALTLSDMETIRGWRSKSLETLRTPYLLTADMQADYYHKTISNRDSRTRYFAIYNNNLLVGYGGIENIEWENGRGEISILIAPHERGKKYGRQAVEMFLKYAFGTLRLEHVWGECYYCGHVAFWEKLIKRFHGVSMDLPCRKFYEGKYYDSLYFDFKGSSCGLK